MEVLGFGQPSDGTEKAASSYNCQGKKLTPARFETMTVILCEY